MSSLREPDWRGADPVPALQALEAGEGVRGVKVDKVRGVGW